MGHPTFGKDSFPVETAVYISSVPIGKIKGSVLKRQAVIGAMLSEFALSEEITESVKKYVSKNISDLIPLFQKRPELLSAAANKSLLSSEHVDILLDHFAGNGESCAVLLEYKERAISKTTAGGCNKRNDADSFRAPTTAELKKLWKTSTLDDGSLELTNYKGSEQEITVPANIGKKQVTIIGRECLAAGGGLFSSGSILAGKAYGIDNTRLQIRSVTVQDGIQEIGEYALCDCVNLAFVTLPETLTVIGDYAFNNCCGLTALTLPSTLKQLGISAFNSCSGLLEVSLPEGLPEVGDYAFYNCIKLTRIMFPASVTYIGNECFHGCPNLTIHAPAGSYAEQYAKENGIPFVAE